MDRYQLTKDILALVDSSPMNNIDIAPVIKKYSEGTSIEEQKILRVTIMSILGELKLDGEIDFYAGNFNITTSTAQVFASSGGNIRGTRKRQERIEEKAAHKPLASVIVGDNFKGNLNTGVVGNDQNFREDLPRHQPIEAPITPQKNINTSILKWLMNNPMAASIVGGIIALIIGTIILKYFHYL